MAEYFRWIGNQIDSKMPHNQDKKKKTIFYSKFWNLVVSEKLQAQYHHQGAQGAQGAQNILVNVELETSKYMHCLHLGGAWFTRRIYPVSCHEKLDLKRGSFQYWLVGDCYS